MNRESAAASPVRDLAQLVRLPNVFTAVADVSMGYLFARASTEPVPTFVALAVASSLLYMAGMALNDAFDAAVDARERPERPIPSGRISRATAFRLGFGLLAGGVLAAVAAPHMSAIETPFPWRSGAVAGALAACIVLYNAALKATLVGPWAMGACRFFNVLLGMSLAPASQAEVTRVLGFDAAELLVAAGIGVYIAGVTWFARSEATTSPRPVLTFGLLVMALGFVLLAAFPNFGAFAAGRRLLLRGGALHAHTIWMLLLVLLGSTIVRRAVKAIAQPEPEFVQATIKHGVMSLIVINAAICLAVRGDPVLALAIVLLIVPALLLGRQLYST